MQFIKNSTYAILNCFNIRIPLLFTITLSNLAELNSFSIKPSKHKTKHDKCCKSYCCLSPQCKNFASLSCFESSSRLGSLGSISQGFSLPLIPSLSKLLKCPHICSLFTTFNPPKVQVLSLYFQKRKVKFTYQIARERRLLVHLLLTSSFQLYLPKT